MTYSTNSNTLKFLWTALNHEVRHPRIASAEKMVLKHIRRGWVFRSDLEDLLQMLDSRLDSYDFNITEFSKILGINWESVCFRPTVIANGVTCFDAIRVEDAALLLIFLERIGFQVDPDILISKLFQSIKSRKKQIFSVAELEIFWFGRCRHKNETLSFAIEEHISGDDYQVLKTKTGYIAELESDGQGHAVRLKIAAPKYKRRGEPISTECPDCGLEWRKGDPESSSWHRKEHKRRMVYLNPQPCQELIEERKTNKEAEVVTFQSPAWKHREIYQRALFFKHERHFDFTQWSESGDEDPGTQGILLTNSLDAIVGAVCFRQRVTENDGDFWELDWVWICPVERGTGHLSQRWNWFKQRFGNFVVSTPVSDEMKVFLERKDDTELMKYPKNRIANEGLAR